MELATQGEIIEVASRMAQELCDLIGEAQESGSDLPGVQALVDDWEAVFKRAAHDWQAALGSVVVDDSSHT
ncbi:MAG: hypothetical protein RPR40_02735 [Bermanella sp.]